MGNGWLGGIPGGGIFGRNGGGALGLGKDGLAGKAGGNSVGSLGVGRLGTTVPGGGTVIGGGSLGRGTFIGGFIFRGAVGAFAALVGSWGGGTLVFMGGGRTGGLTTVGKGGGGMLYRRGLMIAGVATDGAVTIVVAVTTVGCVATGAGSDRAPLKWGFMRIFPGFRAEPKTKQHLSKKQMDKRFRLETRSLI